MPWLPKWVISLLAKTEQRAVIATAPVAVAASRSASRRLMPKRAAVFTIVSPVPDEHLSFSTCWMRPRASRDKIE